MVLRELLALLPSPKFHTKRLTLPPSGSVVIAVKFTVSPIRTWLGEATMVQVAGAPGPTVTTVVAVPQSRSKVLANNETWTVPALVNVVQAVAPEASDLPSPLKSQKNSTAVGNAAVPLKQTV